MTTGVKDKNGKFRPTGNSKSGISSDSVSSISVVHLENGKKVEFNEEIYPTSFYKDFWNNGAEGLYEWQGMVLDDNKILTWKYHEEDDEYYYAPVWDEIYPKDKLKLKLAINDWIFSHGDSLNELRENNNRVNVLVKNPNIITIKNGWRKPYSEYQYIDPNSYKDPDDIPLRVIEEILSSIDEPNGYTKSTTFKEDKVKIDDLRKIKTDYEEYEKLKNREYFP